MFVLSATHPVHVLVDAPPFERSIASLPSGTKPYPQQFGSRGYLLAVTILIGGGKTHWTLLALVRTGIAETSGVEIMKGMLSSAMTAFMIMRLDLYFARRHLSLSEALFILQL